MASPNPVGGLAVKKGLKSFPNLLEGEKEKEKKRGEDGRRKGWPH